MMSTLVPELSPVSNTILAEVRTLVLQLFSSHLSDSHMQVMQEKVQILHRSSFYLELHQEVLQQLQGALRRARTHVRLVLSLMKMLLQEICCCRQDLQGFLEQTQNGPVDSDMISTALTTLRQLHKYLQDFNTRDTRSLGPLNLEKHPLPSSGQLPMPQPTASLVYKLPVVFDTLKSHAKCTTVHLVWFVYRGQRQEPNQLYEVTLHPCVGEQGQGRQFIVMGLSYTVDNLTPDSVYQFSVRYVSTFNLVFSEWMDAITLKTCPLKSES